LIYFISSINTFSYPCYDVAQDDAVAHCNSVEKELKDLKEKCEHWDMQETLKQKQLDDLVEKKRSLETQLNTLQIAISDKVSALD
jgi:hypothetical protein